ncbi:helix-hairpin-helix domain-containing protein [bacterium]|nr:helix-hairpin-helix domain-containing protein [bacterium]
MKKFILSLLLLVCIFAFAGELKIAFINVNQGDAMLISTPEGKHYIVDGGQPAYYDPVKDIYYSRFDAGRDVILPYLKSQGIEKLDGILATHPDADHIGGLVHLLKNMPVDTVYYTGRLHTSNIFQVFLTLSKEKGAKYIEVRDGDILKWSPAMLVNVLAPTDKEMDYAKNNNNTSIVLFIKYGETSFILSGDAEKEQEDRMSSDYGQNLKADLLKFGHHGSKSSSMTRYLNLIAPKYGIISCGKNNKFGFPHKDALDRYYHANSDMLIGRTDYNGHIVAVSDGSKISFEVQKGEMYTMEEVFAQENLTIPGKAAKTTTVQKSGNNDSPLVSSGDLVNINTASQSQLETLHRVGPATARNIINYRDENGPFKRIEDIQNVPRIGPKTFENLKAHITVGDSAAAPSSGTQKKTTTTVSSGALVNINTASQSQLETLHRVGPATARNIINYRNENGPFKKIEDIQNVPRIGPKTFENLKANITVGDGASTSSPEAKKKVEASVSSDELVNINTASQSRLETLHRVGPKTAQNIINYRNENGPFKRIEDIQNVPRIGPKTFENLMPYITVGQISSKKTDTIEVQESDESEDVLKEEAIEKEKSDNTVEIEEEKEAEPIKEIAKVGGCNAALTISPVNINTASEKELDAIPSVCRNAAVKIFNYRQKNGKFKDLSEVQKAASISDRNFKKIKKYIILE